MAAIDDGGQGTSQPKAPSTPPLARTASGTSGMNQSQASASGAALNAGVGNGNESGPQNGQYRMGSQSYVARGGQSQTFGGSSFASQSSSRQNSPALSNFKRPILTPIGVGLGGNGNSYAMNIGSYPSEAAVRADGSITPTSEIFSLSSPQRLVPHHSQFNINNAGPMSPVKYASGLSSASASAGNTPPLYPGSASPSVTGSISTAGNNGALQPALNPTKQPLDKIKTEKGLKRPPSLSELVARFVRLVQHRAHIDLSSEWIPRGTAHFRPKASPGSRLCFVVCHKAPNRPSPNSVIASINSLEV